jgi:hypothetical protein
MESSKPTVESVGLKIGLLTSLALLGYFFIMKALGLSHIIELRIFNFLILGLGICYGIHKLKNELHEENFYLKGLMEGLLITVVALLPFAVFISFYLEYFDVELLKHIKSSLASGEYINGFSIFFVIGMEGMASGAIITYCAMQYFKSVWSEKEQKWV